MRRTLALAAAAVAAVAATTGPPASARAAAVEHHFSCKSFRGTVHFKYVTGQDCGTTGEEFLKDVVISVPNHHPPLTFTCARAVVRDAQVKGADCHRQAG
ncbi:hypothetical protein [Actinomadura gamaensis]|uniref:Secreted protein n=1 Tax=Actinomadura gamaensis TaxID=1763541 RepID=A0ABV9U3P8_9ACTN